MLWLHFGTPKTGTTALQGFLRLYEDKLRRRSLHYMLAGRQRPDGRGRGLISHNQIVFDLTKGGRQIPHFRQQIASEYELHREESCIVSSEMFWTTNYESLAEIFADIPPDQMRIFFCCRRYDDFMEATYKQKAKNGWAPTGATPYAERLINDVETAPERHNYSARTERIRAAFPGVHIIPKLYDRSELVNGNLVDDFVQQMGVALPRRINTEVGGNPSLSRVGSEAFGIVSRVFDRRISRRLRRMVPEDPVMQRKNDVFELKERLHINATLSASDEAFRAEFFPEREALFNPIKVTDEIRAFRRESPQDNADLQRAAEIAMRLVVAKGPQLGAKIGEDTQPDEDEAEEDSAAE